jgi:hypothetical protein
MSVEKPNTTKVSMHVKKETEDGKTGWVEEERELDPDQYAAYEKLHSLFDGAKVQALHYLLSGANPEERAQRLEGITAEVRSLSSTSECVTNDQCPPGCQCEGGRCV